jgi:DNA-binding SARP family transcriptional activator
MPPSPAAGAASAAFAASVTRLALAGTPQVWPTAAGAALPLSERDALLLAWLALEGATPRLRVAELLWPGADAATGRNSLRQRLFKLRRQVGLDLVTGQETLSLAEGVAHDLAGSAQVLGGLVLSMGGDAVPWLQQERQRRRTVQADALTAQAAAAEREQDWSRALQHAQSRLALDPLSEAAHRGVMRLHYLAGDRAAALLAFDRCERQLKDDVGARPDAETLALLATIESAAPSPGLPATVTARHPASVMRPPRLVGRQGAWQALEDAWATGRLAVLTGDAGLGKTRLAGDFAAAHAAVMAGARPGDERVAYASVSRLLRALPAAHLRGLDAGVRQELARLLPELDELAPARAPALQGGAAQARFFNAAALAFARQSVVFDDLHFADDASLVLLQAMAGNCGPSEPSRWLLTSRPGEGSAALLNLFDAWRSASDVVQVPLSPLTLEQVRELLSSLAWPGLDVQAAAPLLLQRSGGNPLFLLESLKAGWTVQDAAAGQPTSHALVPGVQALIERRISRLSPGAVQLARCAALAAPDFSIELASHVLSLRTLDLADPWAELEAAHVLVDGAFAHDLIFEAARASVPGAVARQLHAEIAAFLAARGGEPARLAAHWTQASRWAEAGAAWCAAAARSRLAGRALDAAALFGQAADCLDRARDVDARFDALAQRAWLLSDEHHGQDALAAVEHLQALAVGEAQRLRALEVHLNLAANRLESATVVDQGLLAIAAARRLGQPDRELRLAIVVADSLGDLQRAPEAVALLEPYADWVQQQAAPEACPDYWSALALALDYANRLRDAMPAWEATRTSALRAGRHDMLWKTLANAASTLSKMGYVPRAAEQYGQACALAADSGEQTLRLLQTRAVWAHRLRDVGRYADALELLEAGLAAVIQAGALADVAGVEHRLAQLFQQLGQPDRATHLLATDRPYLPRRLQTVRLMHRADVAHERGHERGRQALGLMREALALSPDPEDIYHRMACLFATRIVPADEGEAMATSLAAWASARERMGLALAAHVRAAGCALRQGAASRARPHAEAALHLAADRWPDSFYLPELWLVAGQVEAAQGHTARAVDLWRRGLTWVRQVAQVPDAFRDSFAQRNPVNRDLLRELGPHAG